MPERLPLSHEPCTARSTQKYEFVRFPQGTHVSFKVQGKVLSGRINGIAMTEAPGIGATYIIQLDQDLSPTYPYTHISIPASMLTVLA